MPPTPNRARQDLRLTWRALIHLLNNPRLAPEDSQALNRVLLLIEARYTELRNHDQDLHP